MTDAAEIKTENTGVAFDTSVYSQLAIKKAAYKFTDRASIIVVDKGSNQVEAQFMFPSGSTLEVTQKILDEFRNEVLDQDLRETIALETEAIRNLILAQAFSKTSLLEG